MGPGTGTQSAGKADAQAAIRSPPSPKRRRVTETIPEDDEEGAAAAPAGRSALQDQLRAIGGGAKRDEGVEEGDGSDGEGRQGVAQGGGKASPKRKRLTPEARAAAKREKEEKKAAREQARDEKRQKEVEKKREREAERARRPPKGTDRLRQCTVLIDSRLQEAEEGYVVEFVRALQEKGCLHRVQRLPVPFSIAFTHRHPGRGADAGPGQGPGAPAFPEEVDGSEGAEAAAPPAAAEYDAALTVVRWTAEELVRCVLDGSIDDRGRDLAPAAAATLAMPQQAVRARHAVIFVLGLRRWLETQGRKLAQHHHKHSEAPLDASAALFERLGPRGGERVEQELTRLLTQYGVEHLVLGSEAQAVRRLLLLHRKVAERPYRCGAREGARRGDGGGRQEQTYLDGVGSARPRASSPPPPDLLDEAEQRRKYLFRIWIAVLRQIPMLSEARARAIAAVYPTCRSLYDAYQACGPEGRDRLLAEVEVRDEWKGGQPRALGPALSRVVATVFNSVDGSERINRHGKLLTLAPPAPRGRGGGRPRGRGRGAAASAGDSGDENGAPTAPSGKGVRGARGSGRGGGRGGRGGGRGRGRGVGASSVPVAPGDGSGEDNP